MEKDYLSIALEHLPDTALREHRYDEGDIVFHQGSTCGGLWMVQSGQVDLERITESGHLVLIHRARDGEPFAEASLFSSHYHCTARAARAATRLTEVARGPLLLALRSQSDFAASLCAMLAGQVQLHRRQVEIISIRDATERVYQAAAHGMLGDDIKAFSARIALSHEAVYRALAELARQGRMAKLGRGRFRIAATTDS